MRSEAAFDREAHQCNVNPHSIRSLWIANCSSGGFWPASEVLFLVIQPCKIQVADALYRRSEISERR